MLRLVQTRLLGIAARPLRWRPRRMHTYREVRLLQDLEVMGAIDYMLLEGHGKKIDGAFVPPLLDLVDRRLIRILDVLVLVKRGEGDFDALTTSDLDADRSATSVPSRARRRGCCRPKTRPTAAGVLQSRQPGLLLVYENCGPSISRSLPGRPAASSWPTGTSRRRPSWPRSTSRSQSRRGTDDGTHRWHGT